MTITVINAGLGASIAIAMYFVGLPNPLLWGALAFALKFLPFVGAVAGAFLVAAFGILSFDNLGPGLLPRSPLFDAYLDRRAVCHAKYSWPPT